MDLRTHYPYSLLRYGILHTYPSLHKNIRTDVAVIGAGITGSLVAYHLQKAGVNCIVFDKRHVAMGSTAASTSLIQYEIDKPLHQLIKLVGYNNAVRSYELCRQAIYNLKQVCIEVNNENNFEEKYSLQFASYKKDVKSLEEEYKIRKQTGFSVGFLTENDVARRFHFAAPAALLTKEAAQVDAYLLTHKILQSLHSNNCRVFDHTNIVSIKHGKTNIQLLTQDGFTITCKKLVIACGYESSKYISRKMEDLRCTYAIITEPLQQKKLWENNCLLWETADPYLYIRTAPGNRILVGGKDTKYISINEQLDLLPKKAKALQHAFHKLFPHLSIKTDFKWAGAFAATKDGLPYIGCLPNLPKTYFALGYGGNGITFSIIAAQLISSEIAGKKHPDMSIFSFNR